MLLEQGACPLLSDVELRSDENAAAEEFEEEEEEDSDDDDWWGGNAKGKPASLSDSELFHVAEALANPYREENDCAPRRRFSLTYFDMDEDDRTIRRLLSSRATAN